MGDNGLGNVVSGVPPEVHCLAAISSRQMAIPGEPPVCHVSP